QTTPNINDLIAQTQALIEQINILRGQQGASSGTSYVPSTTVPASAPVAGICPTLSRALSHGMSGSDVSSLQQFLAQDPSVYPDRLVTGYYGSLTQAAVQRWQAKNGIVSSGTPSSTGFGVVGPRTRAAMMASCGSGSVQTPSSTAGGYIQVSPATGIAPLTVSVTATVNTTNSCVGTPYLLDFGDGPASKQVIPTAGTCTQQTQTFKHTYENGGVYTVALSAGGHQTTASVTVGGTQTGGNDTIHPSVATGTVPLLVTFTGTVNASDAGSCTSNCFNLFNFGDGASVPIPLPENRSGYQTYTTYIVSHTYDKPGAYIASITTNASTTPTRTFVFTPITVSGNVTPPPTPTLTINTNVSYIAQGNLLPVSWQSQNAATSSAVGLWLVNVQSGAIYPLAMTLNTTGNINAPIPATAAEGTVPPVGPYVVLGKIYTPADAVLTGVTPTYIALGRSGTFNILLAQATSTPTTQTSSNLYQILSVATGVGGNQALVNMKIGYPMCSNYLVDWGDGNPFEMGGPGGVTNCGSQKEIMLGHTYQQNGIMTLRLLNQNGAQQATAAVSISNVGTTTTYGMTSVTSGVGGNPLNVAVQLSVPACPTYTLDWGDNSSPVTQIAATGCTGTTRQSPIFNHTYAQEGSYVIKLSDKNDALQSSSSIHLEI
ncbi:hypothetical protein FJY93_04985, partial [Candidatus Kaiserbacteria bacterium]|nr:hypothetical protein [Candidatus Kaiserbacteria bacterium]